MIDGSKDLRVHYGEVVLKGGPIGRELKSKSKKNGFIGTWRNGRPICARRSGGMGTAAGREPPVNI